MTNLDLRPLSLGEILDRTFSLYRQSFWLFVGISALPQLPVLAVNLTRLWLTRGILRGRVAIAGSPPTIAGEIRALGAGVLISIVLGAVAYLFTHGGTVFAVSELYLGRTTTIGASLRRVWRKVGKLLGVVMLNFAAVIVGLIVFILPGFYVACRLITSVPAALLEDLGPGESIARSSRLTESSVGRSFVIYLLYYCLLITAVVLFVYPFTYATILSIRDPSMRYIWSSLGQMSNFVAGVVVSPIFTISTTVFYYDLRVRKEAFDLQLMMNQIGDSAPQAAGVPPTLT